jgi:hypothetical protein
MLVYLAVVSAAHRDGELVADFPIQSLGLRKAQMVGVGGCAAADQAGLLCHKSKMVFVAQATDLSDRKTRDFIVPAARRRQLGFGRPAGGRARYACPRFS